jgi:hypothetical protein
VLTPHPDTGPRVHGEAIVYRLFDVGYGIALDRAFDLLASSAPERRRPSRGEAQSIQIPNPPITASLEAESTEAGGRPVEARLTARMFVVDGRPVEVDFSARVFDFGVVSLRAKVAAEPGLGWDEFTRWGIAVTAAGWNEVLESARDRLLARIGPAVEQPSVSALTEDYTVFRVHRLLHADGEPFPPAELKDGEITRLLLGEQRPLAAGVRKELLSPRLAYLEDDLVVLTWGAALVVEPATDDTDVQYVLEFANAQLLELRWYDAILDAEVPAIQTRFVRARQGFHLLGRRYSRLLEAVQRRVADSVEVIERVENSLKVTDDVFLARVYAQALEEFRERTWRTGIERKMAILRDTYDMLNAESIARRGEMLELVIVLLIAFEIALVLLRR